MSQGTRTMPRARRKGPSIELVVVVALVAVVIVVGIGALLMSGGDDEVAAPATGPGGAQLDTYPVPDVDKLDKVGAKAKQTKVTSCDALEQGGWQALGTVENTGDEAQDYDITVFFMRGEDPVNFAQTTVSAPADGTVPWVVEKVFGTDADLTCKLVAVG